MPTESDKNPVKCLVGLHRMVKQPTRYTKPGEWVVEPWICARCGHLEGRKVA